MASGTPKNTAAVTDWRWPGCVLCLGTLLEAVHLQTLLQDFQLAGNFMSAGLWRQCVGLLGGKVLPEPPGHAAEVDFLPLFLFCAVFSALSWWAGGWWIARCRKMNF